MFERSSDSDGGHDGRKTGLRKHLDRRSVLRKTAYTSAAAMGLSTARPVAASDFREILDGSDPDSNGDHVRKSLIGANSTECTEVELAIGSAMDGTTTYADDPAPLMCNWCAQINSSAGSTTIDNLEMTVSIDNPGVGWNLSDAKESLREAPFRDGFEPSFDVSVSLFFASFGLSFSPDGSANDISFGPESVTYNFGEVCGTCGLCNEENAGWLYVHLNDPTTGCETTNCEVSVDVTADVTYSGSGPGPCGSGDFLTDTLSAHNSFEVEFAADDC